jgi:hypothetical protein
MIRKCVSKFKEGRDNVHDEPRSGRPSEVRRRGDRNRCLVTTNALIKVETIRKSSLRCGESNKNNTF